MDGQEGGYNVDGVEELEDSFTTGWVCWAHGRTDLGVWLSGWWRFSAEGGLGEAVNCVRLGR